MSAIADAAQALAGLLRAAEDGELPMPYTVQVSNFAPHGHEAYNGDRYRKGGISLGVESLADLTAWAIWLDSPIDDSRTSAESRHHNAYGYAGPIPVNVYTLTDLAAEAVAR